MKSIKLLLIFAIICYCFTQTEVFDCEGEFDILMQRKCEAIGPCSYIKEFQTCIETRDCFYGNGNDRIACQSITPKNFNLQKCILDGTTCKEAPKECSNYRPTLNDDCSKLTAPSNKRCVLDKRNSGRPCADHFDECSSITSITSGSPTEDNDCTKNIPKDPLRICKWNPSETGTGGTCVSTERYCDDPFIKDIDSCHNLPVQTNEHDEDKKKCIYFYNEVTDNADCIPEYEKCEDIDLTYYSDKECGDYSPLNDDKDDYNYTMKCTVNTAITGPTKCKAVKRKCKYYDSPKPVPAELLSEEFCNQLEVTETYQKCVYDVKNKGCKEEYQTCEDYITNKVETDRTNCESIVLSDKTKECVYIQKEDKCETRNIYSECKDYEGKDKKICESIVLSPNNRPYCILDKDSECIEKPLNCTEATNEDECLKLAKATDSNKRCAYKNNKCYEEYIRCEDFFENVESDCTSIKLYDGKTCKYDSSLTSTTSSSRCRSIFKTCSDTNKKEECILIAKTGVTNPDRRVCDWIETTTTTETGDITYSLCVENYKYCSDYRGDNITTCEIIKPYDETGENIDIGFKCTLEEKDVGCQKVPVECNDAGDNPILCELYSQYIKDKEKKYCFFDGNSCKSHFKKCDDYEYKSDNDVTSCSSNIIEGFTTRVCGTRNSKCVAQNTCTTFSSTPTYRDLICESINPNCTYDSGKCKFVAKSCNYIKFYSDDEKNKETCENIEVTDPHKKCALKEDKTGCEEIYRELEYSTAYISFKQETSSEGNSSGFTEKGILLIMVLLCLLL